MPSLMPFRERMYVNFEPLRSSFNRLTVIINCRSSSIIFRTFSQSNTQRKPAQIQGHFVFQGSSDVIADYPDRAPAQVSRDVAGTTLSTTTTPAQTNASTLESKVRRLENENHQHAFAVKHLQKTIDAVSRVSEQSRRAHPRDHPIAKEMRVREKEHKETPVSQKRNADQLKPGTAKDKTSSFIIPPYRNDRDGIRENLHYLLRHFEFNPSAAAEELVDLVRGFDVEQDYAAILHRLRSLEANYQCAPLVLTDLIFEVVVGRPQYRFDR